MRADSPNWVVLGEPAIPAEAAALEAFRELLPEDGGEPVHVAGDRRTRLEQQESDGVTLILVIATQRHGQHGRAAKTGIPADPVVAAAAHGHPRAGP